MPASSMRRLRSVRLDEEADRGGDRGRAAAPLRVALATHDLRTMNAHFAGARNFAIYEVTAEEARFAEALRFDRPSAEDGVHGDVQEDRITPRADALAGCALLFVLAIGGPAAAKVVNRGIHPVKLAHPEPIDQVLDRVRGMLRTAPPPWLRKAMGGGRGPGFAAPGFAAPGFVDDDPAEED